MRSGRVAVPTFSSSSCGSTARPPSQRRMRSSESTTNNRHSLTQPRLRCGLLPTTGETKSVHESHHHTTPVRGKDLLRC